MNKKLQLVFLTANNKTFTINIDNPLEPINNVNVKSTMDTIISSNIINSTNGELVDIKGAYLVTKTIEEIQLV